MFYVPHFVILVYGAFHHGGFRAPGHIPLVQPPYRDPTVADPRNGGNPGPGDDSVNVPRSSAETE
jgi:hypothetical protein